MACRLTVRVASDDEIRARSGGEVKTRDTLDAGFPVPGGMYDDQIFGPLRFFTCGCAEPPPSLHPGYACKLCGQEPVPVADPVWGPPGHVVLPDAMPHPLCLGVIARLVGRSVDEIHALASGQAVLVADGGPGTPPPGTIVAFDDLDRLRTIDQPPRFRDSAPAVRALIEEARRQERPRSETQASAWRAFEQTGIDPGRLFIGVVPLLPLHARGMHGPFASVLGHEGSLLYVVEKMREIDEVSGFFIDRDVEATGQPLTVGQTLFLAVKRMELAQPVYGMFENERLPRPDFDYDDPARAPVKGLTSHLLAQLRSPCDLAFDGGQQVLDIDDTPRTRAFLEGAALTVVS